MGQMEAGKPFPADSGLPPALMSPTPLMSAAPWVSGWKDTTSPRRHLPDGSRSACKSQTLTSLPTALGSTEGEMSKAWAALHRTLSEGFR